MLLLQAQSKKSYGYPNEISYDRKIASARGWWEEEKLFSFPSSPACFLFFFFPAFQRHKETSTEKTVYQLQLAAIEVLLISKSALFLLDFAIVSVLYGSNFKWIFGDQNSIAT